MREGEKERGNEIRRERERERCQPNAHLFALLQQQLQPLVGAFVDHLVALGFVLALRVVHVDAEVERHIH